jgi:hypothetical protein
LTPKFSGYVDQKGRLHTREYAKYSRRLAKLQGCDVWHTVEKQEPTRSDPLRRYYFKWVMGPVADHTGASVEAIHHEMKLRYCSEKDEFGITHIESVFSDESKMKIPDKKRFVLNVRNFWLDFQNIVTPEFEPRVAVE